VRTRRNAAGQSRRIFVWWLQSERKLSIYAIVKIAILFTGIKLIDCDFSGRGKSIKFF
jgi:hypothetical protein